MRATQNSIRTSATAASGRPRRRRSLPCRPAARVLNVSQRVEFETCPQQLLVSLERVQALESGRHRKATTPVALPDGLELIGHRQSGRFLLSGVIVHCGTATERRHYVCVAARRSPAKTEWHRYDDGEVTLLGGLEEVQQWTQRYGLLCARESAELSSTRQREPSFHRSALLTRENARPKRRCWTSSRRSRGHR